MKRKAYYYMVTVPPAIQRGVMYFKAYKKADIKDYCLKKFINIDHIFDPGRYPISGINYIDLTEN